MHFAVIIFGIYFVIGKVFLILGSRSCNCGPEHFASTENMFTHVRRLRLGLCQKCYWKSSGVLNQP